METTRWGCGWSEVSGSVLAQDGVYGIAGDVAEEAAAREEGITPAMVGRRIDQLEERLGVKLFKRSTRKVTLTPEGAKGPLSVSSFATAKKGRRFLIFTNTKRGAEHVAARLTANGYTAEFISETLRWRFLLLRDLN